MGALLGAVLGVALALMLENGNTSGAVAAARPERATVLAAGPSSNQPPASPAASSTNPGNDQRAQSADQRDGKADKHKEVRRDKPGKAKGKDKPGKQR